MRTSFLDSEDKALVQIALLFDHDGLRITSAYVPRRMKTKRAPQELHLRLSSLKRTYAKGVRDFSRCYFKSNSFEPLFGDGNRICEGQGGGEGGVLHAEPKEYGRASRGAHI
ncbi:hypothetical protein GQ600_18943 [Phytophthora cactorum]|nr:hypothetical protein GQ600_18943 [Phytophthora cactorum]